MIVRKRPIVPAKYSILFIYCLIILYAAASSLKKPAYNWDILPCMGVILSYDKADAKAIHSEVYAIAKKQVPAVYYNRMIDPSNTYRNSVAQSPEVFYSQFPFYIVKPLYTGAAYLLYKAGIDLPMEQIFAVIFVVIIIARFILQPLITGRLYIPYYLSVIAFLVKKSSVAINQQQ